MIDHDREEQKKIEDEQKKLENKKRIEESRKIEEMRKFEEQKKMDDQRIISEQMRLEQERMESQKKIEEQKQNEEENKQNEMEAKHIPFSTKDDGWHEVVLTSPEAVESTENALKEFISELINYSTSEERRKQMLLKYIKIII